MENLLEALSFPWAIRALVAAVMIGLMCGILGAFIVLRNMSLIGDALSHSILPGIFFAFIIVGYSTLGFFIGSVIAGIITTMLITWIQLKVKTKNDAAIGIVFTFMFAIGVMGISWLSNEQGAHLDLKDFLFGNVLGVSNEDLYLTGFICFYTILSVTLFYRYLFISTFQPIVAETMGISVKTVHYFLMILLSLVVVSALKTVGVILVVSMLITPSASALLLSDKLKNVLIISAILGMVSSVLGLIVAILFDTTPGPAIVVVATFFYILAAAFSPSKGLVFQYFRKKNQSEKVNADHILKFLLKNNQPFSTQEIGKELGLKSNHVSSIISKLKEKELVLLNNQKSTLSEKGKNSAEQLVRAHRLWESYQVEKMGLNADQIHEEAEIYEHTLTAELLDKLEHKLGYPDKDPHGSPIPGRTQLPTKSILNLGLNNIAKITKSQLNQHIESELWELGIMPESEFSIKEINDKNVVINIDNKQIRIKNKLAKMIAVS
jgi:ABC-type Mn2+/Zn2+ transport system permease subunit/Mn-dependent DtxR family transcriptional regulator